MNRQDDLQPALRQQANGILRRLSSSEREALLIKNWMSHDARWFMAVAQEFGMAAVNRVNRIAAQELGKAEAPRILRALQLPLITRRDDFLLLQEAIIGLQGPDLIDYRLSKIGDRGFQIKVQRCFAYDNVARAGIADQYECGILPRVVGWIEAFGLEYEITPCIAKCLKTQGQECRYTITLEANSQNPKGG